MTAKPELRRYHAWQSRILMDRGGPSLGFYGELWRDPLDHPAREPLEHLAARAGADDVSPRYFLIRTLLRDVLHAAGGVEYHAERVLAALDQSQREQDDLAEKDPTYGWQPGIEEFHVPIKESLAWDYPDLLTWLRTVEERICRRVPRSDARIGLLPAIGEPELRAEVERLLRAFKDRDGDERQLANYGLHAAKLPGPSTPSALLQEDGTILVPVPDPPEEPVYVFDLFTYEKGRDLRTFAIEALAATEQLIDGLLDEFARAHERIRATGGEVSPGT
jgi:hypothetical protein